MRETAQIHLPVPSRARVSFEIFCRAVALLCAGLGLLYWVRLIGFYEGTTWRFDLMPAHWQIAAVCLAALYPFAAAGLWMLASWGPVIWVVCAVGEGIMYGGFPELYGRRDLVLVIHALTAITYVGFRIHRLLERRRNRN